MSPGSRGRWMIDPSASVDSKALLAVTLSNHPKRSSSLQ